MTLKKFLNLYKHYKNHYDFELKQISYQKLEEEASHQGEMFPDD